MFILRSWVWTYIFNAQKTWQDSWLLSVSDTLNSLVPVQRGENSHKKWTLKFSSFVSARIYCLPAPSYRYSDLLVTGTIVPVLIQPLLSFWRRIQLVPAHMACHIRAGSWVVKHLMSHSSWLLHYLIPLVLVTRSRDRLSPSSFARSDVALSATSL
jgi:hypothetical protein